jgi:hypothetical protein
MKRILMVAITLFAGTLSASAQSLDDLNIQIHGFATQSFVKSGANNYLGMNTSSGSTAWTEAAINVNDQVTDKLRVGVQFHYTRLGAFGGDDLSLDWALGDYKLNRWLGVRAGKVKMRWGLYNDTQDYDPGYMWSLLPEGIYGVDIRATDLSQNGAELYGRIPIGRTLGNLAYSVYYGDYTVASNDGIMDGFNESGLTFASPPGGKTPGFDLRWATPAKGLKVGGSLMMYDATGNLTNGTYVQPLAFWPAYYAQYDGKKLFLSYQYTKLVQYQTVTINGSAPSTSGFDTPSWFAMGGYHLTDKLQAGVYYTSLVVASALDKSDPANYFHDWAASSRYDINANFYAKLEGHFIDGNAAGFYGFNNPNGLNPKTNVLVAKVGFTF